MKRIALDVGTSDSLVQEAEIERGVVADQDGPRTTRLAHRAPHFTEYALQRLFLTHGDSERVMRVDAVDGQRGGLQVRTFEGFYVLAKGLSAAKRAVVTRLDDDGRDLGQGVGLAV